ncbi:hypothetical protein DL95DRAFT_413402 [Leptodontidium sp. 2 PMI_412]|nr:hypothetical protein DL95DRAFT_413402 [Leptodontidium sp. 2 PMI_412]
MASKARKRACFCARRGCFGCTTFSQLLEIAQPEDIDAIIGEGKNLLHIAAIMGHQGRVRVLVDMCGANPNTPSGEYRNRTAIVYAALRGYGDTVADLQDRGANNNSMLLSEWRSAYSYNEGREISRLDDILAELKAELSFVDPATMARLVAKAKAEARRSSFRAFQSTLSAMRSHFDESSGRGVSERIT